MLDGLVFTGGLREAFNMNASILLACVHVYY